MRVGCESELEFEWQQQLLYTWDKALNTVVVKQWQATIAYGFEYLGSAPRLVMTPETEQAVFAFTQAAAAVSAGSSAQEATEASVPPGAAEAADSDGRRHSQECCFVIVGSSTPHAGNSRMWPLRCELVSELAATCGRLHVLFTCSSDTHAAVLARIVRGVAGIGGYLSLHELQACRPAVHQTLSSSVRASPRVAPSRTLMWC